MSHLLCWHIAREYTKCWEKSQLPAGFEPQHLDYEEFALPLYCLNCYLKEINIYGYRKFASIAPIMCPVFYSRNFRTWSSATSRRSSPRTSSCPTPGPWSVGRSTGTRNTSSYPVNPTTAKGRETKWARFNLGSTLKVEVSLGLTFARCEPSLTFSPVENQAAT